MKIGSLLLSLCILLFAGDEQFYYDGNEKMSLKPLPTLVRSNTSVEYYEDARGKKVGVSNTLLAQFKRSENLQRYLREFGASVQKDFGGNLFLIAVPNAAETIDAANALHIREDVLFAHPNFLRTMELR